MFWFIWWQQTAPSSILFYPMERDVQCMKRNLWQQLCVYMYRLFFFLFCCQRLATIKAVHQKAQLLKLLHCTLCWSQAKLAVENLKQLLFIFETKKIKINLKKSEDWKWWFSKWYMNTKLIGPTHNKNLDNGSKWLLQNGWIYLLSTPILHLSWYV